VKLLHLKKNGDPLISSVPGGLSVYYPEESSSQGLAIIDPNNEITIKTLS
jgi:hypothetical protein